MDRPLLLHTMHAVLATKPCPPPAKRLATRLREAIGRELKREPTNDEILEAFDTALGLLGVHFTGLRDDLAEALKSDKAPTAAAPESPTE
jgi:hypothetical protein